MAIFTASSTITMNKKLLLLALCSALSVLSYSQAQWFLFAGPQATSSRFVVSEKVQSTGYQFGFQAGIGSKLPAEGKLWFVPSLMFSRKGYTVTFNQPSALPDSAALKNSTTINTVQLNLLLQHDFSLAKGHLFFRIGPALDIAINGKETYSTATAEVSRNMPFNFSDYGRYGSSAEFHIGFEKTGGFMLYGFYSHGLGNVSNVDNGPKIRYRAAGFSLGAYIFKKKKK